MQTYGKPSLALHENAESSLSRHRAPNAFSLGALGWRLQGCSATIMNVDSALWQIYDDERHAASAR